ncbi:MAG: ASKHA domain-containing protein [Armatimonadota bacterium]
MESQKISVKFLPAGKAVELDRGTLVSKAAETAGVTLAFPCGGKGRCGKCKVIFEQGAPAPTPTEFDTLTETELVQGYRLGCTSALSEDAVIYTPNGAGAAKILTAGVARDIPIEPWITKKFVSVPAPSITDLRSDLKRLLDGLGMEANHTRIDLAILRGLGELARDSEFNLTVVLAGGEPVGIEPLDTASECYGVAVDIGTTTMAAYLLDLVTGKQVSVAASINPQTRIGDDVISRIAYASDGGLSALHSLVVGELNNLIQLLCAQAEVAPERVYEVAVVGNTCMSHLFLGIDPRHLAQAPYVPTVSQSVALTAAELDVRINPFGRVHVLPNIAGYVGADTVGVILATGMHESEEMTLAIDIGTNGEIVLGSNGRMLACSTAAGPAFEGAHIKHGMRAAPGAIDSAWLDGDKLAYSTVGGEKVTGICGSGLLDVIISLVQAGIIEASGRIVDVDEVPEQYACLRDKLVEGGFVLAEGAETASGIPVTITQRDVREVQLAKGAIAAGISALMDRLGVSTDDLDRVVLAGAFGNYLRKESAVAAGMIPNVPLTKVHSVGNAAGEGAKLALLSRVARETMDEIAGSVEYVELTTDPGFQDRFADSLMFDCGS